MKKIKILFIFILSFCVFLTSNNVSASEQYTDVFNDLRNDENFNVEDYPNMTLEYIKQINTDTNDSNDQEYMEVISIAESTAKELYIYVYQPTHNELDLIATSISLSIDYSVDGQDIYPNLYDLELVSTYSVFDKYVVKDFVVCDEVYRYYNLVALYREYNSTIDSLTVGSEAPGTEIAMSVGQQWCVYYQNNDIVYEMGTFETLEITPTFTGNFEFSNGLEWGNLVGSFNWGNAWFISFNVEDYVVKHIYDADLSYRIRSVTEKWTMFVGSDYTYGEWSEDIKITLKDTDEMIYKGDGWLAKEYSWNRISSASEFLNRANEQDVTISDECKEAVKSSQWVFTFLETEWSQISYDGGYTNYYSDIEDITILRLHFIDIKDDVYNLGVVMDKVNPDNSADGTGSGIDTDELFDSLEKLFALIMLILLLVVIGYVFPIANILIKIFGVMINGIYFVITLPFKLISKPFKKKNKSKKPY